MLDQAGLNAAVDDLPVDPRITFGRPWRNIHATCWAIQFDARLSVAPSAYMGACTPWWLVVGDAEGEVTVEIFPDASGGIEATFPHQNYNRLPDDGQLWRDGKPCLERVTAIFKRTTWGEEPLDLRARIGWRIARLLEWIDAAASDALTGASDPFELPALPDLPPHGELGFLETQAGLGGWLGRAGTWGFAEFAAFPGASSSAAVADWRDERGSSFNLIPWGTGLQSRSSQIDAVWLALPSLPVDVPWQAASTWRQLSEQCHAMGVDLPSVIVAAGKRLRRMKRIPQREKLHLLLGFPISERIGEAPSRFHWLAIRDLSICGRAYARKGFQPKDEYRAEIDRAFSSRPTPLAWRRTANWASDQLRKRGEAEATLRSRSVLVLGIGTLGSAVSENLARMGVTDIGLMDFDRLAVGNLSRHSLSMAEVGTLKAISMAARLNSLMPDLRARAFSSAFPPTPKDRAAIAKFDVIVDCTASDPALREIGRFSWGSEKLFVSLAMGWAAKSFFAYAAREAAFPAIDVADRFAKVAGFAGPSETGVMEGIGCWHPIFPASADDVQLWAAIGTKFIRSAAMNLERSCKVYRLTDSGEIESTDV